MPYKSVIFDYDDESGPVELIGKKMLPILKKENGEYINESLDIIKYLDKDSKLNPSQDCFNFLNEISSDLFKLSMPYMIYTPEFNESSRNYFRSKKESSRGSFKDLVENSSLFLENFNTNLKNLELNLNPFFNSENIGLDDFLIASHLWGMYLVHEFQFSEKIHTYLQEIKKATDFNYLGECWK